MNVINGRKLRTKAGVNKGYDDLSFVIHGGDVVTVVANGKDGGGWVTVRRDSDGLIDTAPPYCFKYLNNKPVKL